MVSKNNYSEKKNKLIDQQKSIFSIRKFATGAASVVIGLTFVEMNNQKALADTDATVYEENIDIASSSNNNSLEMVDDNSVEFSNESENEIKINKDEALPQTKITDDKDKADITNTEEKLFASSEGDNNIISEDNHVSKKNLSNSSANVQSTATKKHIMDNRDSTSVTIPATDTEKYPKDAANLVTEEKYIYQILNLSGTNTTPNQNNKLILSVSRKDLTDENIYAYVTDTDFKNIIATHVIQSGYFKRIEVHGQRFLIVNSGKSNITIDGSSTSVGNSTTVIGNARIEYGLGNITNLDATSIGEIVPVHTEDSVIKYYYRNTDGTLSEIPGTEKYPNISVSGWTGQEFKIDNINQYKQLIEGFYLDSSNIPSDTFTGTISQFGDGSYYKKVYYSPSSQDEGTIDQLSIDFTVIYRQVDATGKMEVLMYDGNNMDYVLERHMVEAGQSVKFANNNFTARNPFVTDSAHEVQFVYKKLGYLIPVDENGKHIGNSIQFKNNVNDPTKAGRTDSPTIPGYIADVEYIIPENPGEDIKVVYRLREDAKATITIIDIDNNNASLGQLNSTGKVHSQINFDDLDATLSDLMTRGYVVISNNFKAGTLFDVDDLKFEVQLKHAIEIVNETETVKKVIYYVDALGNEMYPTITQTANFYANGYRDKVTGNIVLVAGTKKIGEDLVATQITDTNASLDWKADKVTFESIESPDIIGYTPNQEWSTADEVERNDKIKKETITYDKKSQVGTIIFWDDTAKKQLGSTVDITGTYGEKINSQVIDNILKKITEYEEKGYILVENPVNYTTVFNDAEHNPGCNDYIVTLKHRIDEKSQIKEVKRIITYIYADGPNKGIAAADTVTQKVRFVGKGQYDFVDQVWINTPVWTAENGNAFAQVNSPNILGYSASKSKVDVTSINENSENILEEIQYYANKQTAHIEYIDSVTGQIIGSSTVNGKVDHLITWNMNPEAALKLFEKKGYKLVSSNYEFGRDYYYSAEDAENNFKVYLIKDVIFNGYDTSSDSTEKDLQLTTTSNKLMDLPVANMKSNINLIRNDNSDIEEHVDQKYKMTEKNSSLPKAGSTTAKSNLIGLVSIAIASLLGMLGIKINKDK